MPRRHDEQSPHTVHCWPPFRQQLGATAVSAASRQSLLGILLSMLTTAFLCWLLFTHVVFAFPLLPGTTAGTWAYGTGSGWFGALVVGFIAEALTFSLGSCLLS